MSFQSCDFENKKSIWSLLRHTKRFSDDINVARMSMSFPNQSGYELPKCTHFTSISLKILWLHWLLIPDSLLVHLLSGNCHFGKQCERSMSCAIALLILLWTVCFLTSYCFLWRVTTNHNSNICVRFVLETTEEKYCIFPLFSAVDEMVRGH